MIVKTLLKVAMLGSSWVMYLLLALSVVSIAAIVERWWFFRRQREDVGALGDRVGDLLDHGDEFGAAELLGKSSMIEAQVIATAFRRIHGGPEAFSAAVDGALGSKRKDLERGMNLLGTLGNNAPFIGLLGTVIGVIEAFAHLGAGQDKSSMNNVMGGIAEALVATGVGLFVAIPAVVAFNVFQRKIAEVDEGVGTMCKQICAALHVAQTSAAPARPREVREAEQPSLVATIDETPEATRVAPTLDVAG
jgi:biopolymer transport protein ExbB/TolQ